jgi:alpha-amylase/alpha-mannosidase (GH57 family)
MTRAHLALLLHMHQPEYVDPLTGAAELPWVRLHGARAYLDVARLLDEHAHVRLTVNFVPSLVSQLEGVVAGRPDHWVAVSRKPTAELEPEERLFLVNRLFSINWGRAIDPRPRYRDLLEKRGREASGAELRERALKFTDADLRDLTVLFFLSWIGFAAREGDRELAALEDKGRGYDLDDLELVLERQRAACAKVLPLYRRLHERGQVELSASPFYHPIVPLLIDTAAAHRAQPDLTLPDRFAYREDAVAQIVRGAEAHARAFGTPPVGMWPPEGSVSPEAVAAYAGAGIRWLATDEGNLWRSRALSGLGAMRGDLYRAYRHGGVDLVFRDRELSDRIGFAYAHGDSAAGADDLLERAAAAARSSTLAEGAVPLVPIFLDGENPWEAYPGSGEPFLRALFARLADHPALEAVTVGEHLAKEPARVDLERLHSGSWIDSDFHIWIGDPVKNRAWGLLERARRRLGRAATEGPKDADGVPTRDGAVGAKDRAAAVEHLYAAEGSDWFWWFGEPFHNAEKAIFDRLFRAHLKAAYLALGETPPTECDRPLDGEVSPRLSGLALPFALISPPITGARGRGNYYAWQGAGRYQVPRGAAMAESPLVEAIHFGFDRRMFYLRVDPAAARAAELEGATLELEIEVGDRRLRVRSQGRGWQLDQMEGPGWRPLGNGEPGVFGRSLELALPLERLGLEPRAAGSFSLRLYREAVPLGRYPADGFLPITVPDDDFEASNWSV